LERVYNVALAEWPASPENIRARDDFYLYIKETDRRNGTDFTKIFPEIAYFYENAGKYYEEARAKWTEEQKSAEHIAPVEEINNSINDAKS
jgi:predicted P-loop ATPase